MKNRVMCEIIGEKFHIFQNNSDKRCIFCFRRNKVTKLFFLHTLGFLREVLHFNYFFEKIPDFTFLRDYITVNKKGCRKTLLFGTYTFISPYTSIRNHKVGRYWWVCTARSMDNKMKMKLLLMRPSWGEKACIRGWEYTCLKS